MPPTRLTLRQDCLIVGPMNWPRATVIVRWIVAGAVGGGGLFLLARVMANESNWMAVFGKSLFGLAGLMTGIVLVAPEIVRWAVGPISHLLDNILLPSETVLPPVDFKLARFYGQGGRYEEACEEYLKTLHYHPDNAEACVEGIRAAALAGNESLAKKFYQRARRIMRSEEKRQWLEEVYAARHQPLDDVGEAEPEALPEGVGETEPEALPERTSEAAPEIKPET